VIANVGRCSTFKTSAICAVQAVGVRLNVYLIARDAPVQIEFGSRSAAGEAHENLAAAMKAEDDRGNPLSERAVDCMGNPA